MARHKTFSHTMARELFAPLAYSSAHDVFINDDQTLGFGFLCSPLSGGDDSLASRINVILNMDWPDDSFLQFNLFASPDIEVYLASIERLRFECKDKLLLDGIYSRTKHFRDATKKPIDSHSGLMVRSMFLQVTAKIPLKSPVPTDKELTEASKLNASLGQGLASAGMGPYQLNPSLYIRIMQGMMNWGDRAGWRDLIVPEWDQTAMVRDQIVDYGSEITVDKNGISLGDKRVSILSLKRYPDNAYFGIARSFLTDIMYGVRGIRGNVMISGTIHFQDAERMRAGLTKKRQFITNQAYGPLAKFVPILLKKQHGFDVLFNAFDDGDRPISFYLGMALFSNSEEEAVSDISNAQTFWRDNGFQLMQDKFFSMPLFLNMLPMGPDPKVAKDLFRYKTFATRHVIPLLPLFGSWQGTGTPTLSLLSREGAPMNYCSFDSQTNFNTIIAATSGAGKSFLANDIIWSYLSTGAQVWVFDIGRSYLNMCRVLEGTFIEFTEESDICLNPFETIQKWEESADMITALICVMASQKGRTSDIQEATIKRVLSELWLEKGQDTMVDDVADRLLQSDDKEIINIGRQLFPFTSAGEYGRFFNGKNNVDISNRFCVLEMEELNGRQHLQKVVLLTMFFQIERAMYLGDKDRQKICFVDEAWSMIAGTADQDNPEVAKVLEGFARKARKYRGGLFVATQSFFDMYQNSVGRAIVENAANKLLLKQSGSNVEDLREQRKLPFNDHEYDLLKSVRTEKGRYSEVYVLSDRGSGIGRLFVDSFKAMLYSTNAEDADAIRLRVDYGGMRTDEAVHDYMKEIRKEEGDPVHSTKALQQLRAEKRAADKLAIQAEQQAKREAAQRAAQENVTT